MSIPILDATTFIRELPSGKTRPCIFFCENDTIKEYGEYIVKLKAGIDSRETGLASELIASQLAILLDIPTPGPAIINLDLELAKSILDPKLSLKLRNSLGYNFGSKFVGPGFQTWPVGKPIPANLRPLAAEIFAFDALIQNPDRNPMKPNVLWKSDDLYMIDHELGFSFIFSISSIDEPWQISKLNFMRNHLFYLPLKGQTFNLDRFSGALESIDEKKLNSIFSNIPHEWQNQNNKKIQNHINEVSKHVNEFIDEIRRILL